MLVSVWISVFLLLLSVSLSNRDTNDYMIHDYFHEATFVYHFRGKKIFIQIVTARTSEYRTAHQNIIIFLVRRSRLKNNNIKSCLFFYLFLLSVA